MAGQRPGQGRRRQGSGSGSSKARPKNGWRLLVVLLLILGLFTGLEWLRGSFMPEPAPPGGRHQLPLRPQYKTLSSVRTSGQHPTPSKTSSQASLPATGGAPRIAIIIDDIGAGMAEARTLLDLEAPLTLSIIPGLRNSAAIATIARQRGREVMLHIPMEPDAYPQRRLEGNGLLLAHNAAEVERRIDAYLAEVPNAAGANNHMGSRYTEQTEKMRTVAQLLKAKGLYFVDSKTSPQSVAEQTSRRVGVKTAARSVFLDNVQDETAIRAQLTELVRVAKRRGSAIGICHPHPATIRVLTAEVPKLRQAGITVVPVSSLVN